MVEHLTSNQKCFIDWYDIIMQEIDEFKKSEIYMRYYINQLGLKHNFTITCDGNFFLNFPNKLTDNKIETKYLWKDFTPMSKVDFFSYRMKDMGEKWKENNYATRILIFEPYSLNYLPDELKNRN